MNRVILIKDTGNKAAEKAMESFVRCGDIVYLASGKTLEIPGVRVLDPVSAAEKIQEKEGKLDILLIGVPEYDGESFVGSKHNYDGILNYITDCAQSNLQLVESCLPLLRNGMKRIACITEKESSNSWSAGEKTLAFHQALAGQNMMGKILFNKLRPEGFTFRWYCAGTLPME